MEFLSWLGFVLTVVGTVLTAWALWGDHRAYGSRPLVPGWPRLATWFKRVVLRRKQDATFHTVGADLHIGFKTEAHAFVILREDAPVEEQVTWLRQQVIDQHQFWINEANTRREQDTYLEGRVNDVGARVDREVQRLDGLAKDIAAGSVRKELFGLGLVGLGAVLSFIPTVFG